ncbi:UvrD-helicase domain-containing protein [Noviherbaspirillum sp. Root189]|uniref:UvrD-helicase domain-containing protein n=1 Tax=Noviherbaspirillum sp. Root189 TaxID=1736487 RepID=UPI00070C5C2E|nr:UvrD-helicase domain-containing protein [Noviherbaspirillum sp. Root189]KRB79051.1 hypothetical protein ASE07_05010 [Noviherbaspirillum sp. Root189]
MSPFLRAREEALKLRIELVGGQADTPVSTKDLLVHVEDILNLGVKEVPHTSGVLKGANATIRRSEGWIYCRQDYSWPEKAYLIAHELGHFRLDPDIDEDTVYRNADGFLPSSPASAYVEAYGARERDELQKNVFGRELLLPRHVARAMFISGKGPRQIAKELGLPLEVARQQVLDAVLLPPYVPKPPAPLPPPSPDQVAAINAPEKHVHVVAGPGTGKTTTLIHRVKKLIEQDNVDPRKILVLTFTNKAAAELVDRLQRAGVKGASEIWAGTFHAFGLEFLRKYYQHFGVTQDVAVADKITQLTATAKALVGVKLEYFKRTDDPYEWLPPVIDACLRIKEELVSIDDYLAKALSTTTDHDERARFRDVAAVARTYQAALQKAGMVDFVDLVAAPALAIAADRVRFSDIVDNYQHVLVDEFQDLTSAMMGLTAQLSLNAKSLWVVGDVRQAIYHWRGASLGALLGFGTRFKSAKQYNLVMNRRSCQEVIDVTVATGELHPLQGNHPLAIPECQKGPSNRSASFVQATSRPSMWKGVVDGVRSDLANGIPLRQQAIISRTGSAVAEAAKELRDAGVPVLYVGELLARPEVKDILAVIQLVVERSPRALLRVGELVTPQMTREDVKAAIEAVSRDGALQRNGWLKSETLPLSQAGHDSRRYLARRLGRSLWSTSPWDFLCELLLEQRFLLADLADNSIDGHLKRLAQWQFVYMARVGDGDRKRPTLFRLHNRLRLRQQIRDVYIDRELPPETGAIEGVRVMTVHASKGLEFQSVHLVSVDGKEYAGAEEHKTLLPPHAIGSSPKQFEYESDVEKHNLLYVAVSRAKDALSIYQSSADFRFESVAALDGAVARKILVARPGPPVFAQPPGLVRLPPAEAPTSATNEGFLAYHRCPREYLYRFGMEMGQELTPNPSLQARGLVRRVLKSLASQGRYDELASAFEMNWLAAHLPERSADPQLWEQAWAAAAAGASYLHSINGKFIEADADVRQLTVGLPWGVAVAAPGGSRLHCVDFYSGAKNYLKGQDNILGQLMSLTSTTTPIVEAELFDLSRLVRREVKPVRVTERSNATKIALGLRAGIFAPKKDSYSCARCSYSYLCPSLPAV